MGDGVNRSAELPSNQTQTSPSRDRNIGNGSGISRRNFLTAGALALLANLGLTRTAAATPESPGFGMSETSSEPIGEASTTTSDKRILVGETGPNKPAVDSQVDNNP